MSKMVLTLEEDYDFSLIGISCHTKDYRLCWEINKSLSIDLFRSSDFEINKKNETSTYSFYECIDEVNYLEYYLISNRSNTGFLIPEQKSVDFFLMLKGNVSNNLTTNIITKLNALALILTTFEINPNSLKSKQNLLF
ncbi:MAG: IPExxxVDY family protein [Vicingaceae bacterium]